MKLFSIRKSNLDELVFANRNKSYGAYDLRKSYDSHLLKAILFTLLLFILLFLLVKIKSLFPVAALNVKPDDPVLFENMSHLELIITPQPKPNPPTARLETRTNPVGALEITAKQVAKEIPDAPAVETTSNNNPAQETGQIGGNENNGVPIQTTGVTGEESNNPELFPDQMPGFPGGMEGLSEFLKTNLTYPASFNPNDLEGKVLVSFIVEKDGSVTHATIEKALGFGYDDEALRVIKLMPKWTPGRQKGKVVSVKFTLPLLFILR